MIKREITNGRISSTSLGFERGVFLTAWIYIDHTGGGQGFGGYVLKIEDKPNEFDFCGEFLQNVLSTVGVEKWEDLVGKYVRIDYDNSKIHRIGNIIKEVWYDPAENFAELE